MSSDFIKAGLKALAAIAAVVAGGTLAKKAHEDYKRNCRRATAKRRKR